MKTDPTEPPRIEEEGPEALRRLVRSRRRSPAPADVQNISAHLVAAGVLGSAPQRGARGEKTIAYFKLGAIGLTLFGALAGTWQIVRAPAAASNVTSVPSPAAIRAPAIVSEVRADDVPVISVDQLPTAQPSTEVAAGARPVASPVKPSAKPQAGTSAANRSASELELLQHAQAIVSSDPRGSLALTNEHARDYPSGEFVQERETIAVEALVHLGQKEEARRRARALLERFPRTPYSAKVAMLLGELP